MYIKYIPEEIKIRTQQTMFIIPQSMMTKWMLQKPLSPCSISFTKISCHRKFCSQKETAKTQSNNCRNAQTTIYIYNNDV